MAELPASLRTEMTTITRRQARRLALLQAGFLKPTSTGLARRASGHGKRPRAAAHRILDRYGYLQLDTVAVAGARSHVIVLLSRIAGFDPGLGESLLQPGEPVFEYWGHEASWLPMNLYPAFEFRRRDYAAHPWWGDLLGQHPRRADALLERLRSEGPLRSMDLEGRAGEQAWDRKLDSKLASAFWSRGDVAIRERRNFQRYYDLAERVIPDEVRLAPLDRAEAFRVLLLRALDGQGWAQTGTLTSTWRLRNVREEVATTLSELQDQGRIVPCAMVAGKGARFRGWIQPHHLQLIPWLDRLRPRRDRGVLVSPFDPVLWDRQRVKRLFGFDQLLEIFKPKHQRIYGYYCLPVLAGDRLVARVDLKADRKAGRLDLLALHWEADCPSPADRRAVRTALGRFSAALELTAPRNPVTVKQFLVPGREPPPVSGTTAE